MLVVVLELPWGLLEELPQTLIQQAYAVATLPDRACKPIPCTAIGGWRDLLAIVVAPLGSAQLPLMSTRHSLWPRPAVTSLPPSSGR